MKITKSLPREANKGEMVALDVEVYGQEKPLHIPGGEFACLSVSFLKAGENYQFYDHHDVKEALERLKDGTWCFHNAMYDIAQLQRWAKIKERPVWDTMLMELGLFGGYYETFSLDALSRRYLGKGLKKEERERFITERKMDRRLEQYAIADARATIQVMHEQEKYIQDNRLDPIWYWDIDMPAMWAVMDFEPIKVDVDAWLRLADDMQVLGELADEELGFNSGSPKVALARIKEVTGNKRIKDTNAKDTLEPLLMELVESGKTKEAEFLRKLLDARMYKKAASTYGKNWVENWVHEGGLVYPGWRITGTETGRMACREPNIQNIPARRLPQFRNLFISKYPRGRIMVSDVSQQEVRINAYFSQDRALLEAFNNDIDIHDYVQEFVDGCDNRDDAKALNFGMDYGMSEYGLAKKTGQTKKEAKAMIKTYFRKFRGVQAYMNQMRKEAVRHEKVHSSTGRPVWLNTYQKQWENNAVNGPIQSTGGDQIKKYLILKREYSKAAGIPFSSTMVHHDEGVSDVRPGETKKQKEADTAAWMDAGKYVIPGIPMKVSTKTGRSWGAKNE